MNIKETDTEHLSVNKPGAQFNPNVSFLQIPTSIKDQVISYVDTLIRENPELSGDASAEYDPAQQSDCFFVVALETIEELLSCLNDSLSHPDRSRELIEKAIEILNGR